MRLEIMSKTAEHVFGCTELTVEYAWTHVKNNKRNIYRIRAHIGGLEIGAPVLRVVGATGPEAENSNEETLTEDAAIQAFQEEYDD